MAAKFLDLNKLWPCKYGRKKKNLTCILLCTQEQNGSPYFSFIVRQCNWPSLSGKVVEAQKFCYHGNVTSHFSLLFVIMPLIFIDLRLFTVSYFSLEKARAFTLRWSYTRRHEKISNDDFYRNTALQCWNYVTTTQSNVATMLWCSSALQIVVANCLV